MKYLITLLLFASCNSVNSSDERYDAQAYNYASYNGRTIAKIEYCNSCGHSGDLLILKFTDGSSLKVYAYKYNMKIYK